MTDTVPPPLSSCILIVKVNKEIIRDFINTFMKNVHMQTGITLQLHKNTCRLHGNVKITPSRCCQRATKANIEWRKA